MWYHTIILLDWICLQRMVVGQQGQFYLSIDTILTQAAI